MNRELPSTPVRARGFGLVELMAAVAVAAILLAVALPNLRELGLNTTTSSTTNDMVGSLNLARSDAVRRGVKVAVVSNSGNGTWTSGWKVKADTARDDTYATIVQAHDAVATGYKVLAKSTGGTDGMLVFTESGSVKTPATKFDINVCRSDNNATKSRWIQITATGEIKSQRDPTLGSTVSC